MPGDSNQPQIKNNTKIPELMEFRNGLLLSGVSADEAKEVLHLVFKIGIAGMISTMKPTGDGEGGSGAMLIDDKQLRRDNWVDVWIKAATVMAESQHKAAVKAGGLDVHRFDIGFSRFALGQNLGAGMGVLHIYPHYVKNEDRPQFGNIDDLLKVVSRKERSFNIDQLLSNSKLSENEVKYIKSVISRLVSTENGRLIFERFKIRIIEKLILFLNRKIPIQELSSELGVLKYMPIDQIDDKSILQIILEEASPEHVISLRDDIDTYKKFEYLSQASLSDAGLKAMHTREAGILPTIDNPRLEYFEPLTTDERTIRMVMDKLAVLQITTGCSHNCLHCAAAPKHKVNAMPFYRILQLLEYGDSKTGKLSGNDKWVKKYNLPNSRSFCLYSEATELLDYYDPLYDADAGDVLRVILDRYPNQKIHITTRGWYNGDRIAERAFKKIVKLSQTYEIDIRISIDPYDIIDNDIIAYAARVGKLLEILMTNKANETRFAVLTNKESEELFKIIMRILSSEYSIPNYSLLTSGLSGNAKKLQDAGKATFDSMHDVACCMFGCHIRSDGSVVYKARIPRDENGFVHRYEETGIRLWNASDKIDPLIPKKRRISDKGFYVDVDEKGFYKKAVSR